MAEDTKRRPKQGAPTTSTADRKAAAAALGKLIRALDKLDIYEEFEPSLSQMDARIREVR